MRKVLGSLLYAVPLLLSAPAWAGGVGVSAQASTLGAGLNLAYGINDHLSVRLNANQFDYNYEKEQDGINYDTDTSLQSVGLLVDWFPFGGTFRVSAGIYGNGNKLNLVARPSGDTYEINGTVYNSEDLGELTGKAKYEKSTAPYVGIGWGHLGGKSGWSASLDIGVLFTSALKTDLSGTCGPALNPLACQRLQNDIEAEEDALQDDVAKYDDYYPVIALGVGYTF